MSATGRGVSDLAGVQLGSRVLAYDERDAILYALAVGAQADDLELVYERDLRVLPTLALGLGLWAVEAAGDLGGYDRTKTLHVGQRLMLRRALPPRAAAIDSTAVVSAVWDKGRAALVEVTVSCEFFDTTYAIYVPGEGGFGGERGPSRAEPRSGDPDLEVVVPTRRDQAALYRLTGDRHPVHIDPAIARSVGFDRPILHGLCTLGCAVLALARATDRDPSDVSQVSARFVAPLYPGDAIGLSAWRTGDGLRFTATAADRAVLADGELS